MGILARFGSREAKDRFQLIKHHISRSKHRLGTKKQNASASSNYYRSSSLSREAKYKFKELPVGEVNETKHSPDETNGRLGQTIQVDEATAAIIQIEVINLLSSNSGHSCTTLEMANALAQSRECLESHSVCHEKYRGQRKLRKSARATVDWAGSPKRNSFRTQSQHRLSLKFLGSSIFSRKSENESMQSRYEWVEALNRLEKYPSSRDQTISTWEEAKKSLEMVISFPPLLLSENGHQDQGVKLSRIHLPQSLEKDNRENLDVEIKIVQDNIKTLSFNSKWKQITEYPIPEGFRNKGEKGYKTDDKDLEILKQKESIDKADLFFNARIRTADDLNNQLQKSEAVRELEERRLANEARKRASLLMRALNDDERDIVETAIDGYGHGDEIVAQAGADSVQRASMQTLKPGMWLNDEIIHYFYLMLAKRDEELCKNDSSRKRSHFFKSFFITKLLNEGNASCDGKYEYRNVKRWSKKVPGKDIFNLDKILFPINMGNMHWICAGIFMKEKRIEIFDSMGSKGNTYLEALFNYVQDEHMDKKKSPLPDADSWQLVPTQRDTPRQTNGMFVFQNLGA